MTPEQIKQYNQCQWRKDRMMDHVHAAVAALMLAALIFVAIKFIF